MFLSCQTAQGMTQIQSNAKRIKTAWYRTDIFSLQEIIQQQKL